MSVGGRPDGRSLRDLYLAADDDLTFTEILERVTVVDDAALADLIETDGRLRLNLGRDVTLDRYLQGVDHLRTRAEPLDAAIDMCLRQIARGGFADDDAIGRLVERHPDLESAIRESAALNNALWSTQHLHRHLERAAERTLPCDFGPRLEDGRARYELRELLGEGSFGEVYVAVDRQLSEPEHEALVSIKIMAGGGRTDWTRQQLIDEATKARRINHPNVVSVLDRGVSADDEDFIVYEYVNGGDLYQWYRRRRDALTVREIAALVERIARGVHAAHMAGLVHCDLKPGNVVLTADGEPKVVDFGIAIRSGEREQVDSLGASEAEPMGNLAFMSPEQFRREEGALTIPSDVYALGGMLFWLLAGELPNGDDPAAVRRTHDPETGRREAPSATAYRDDLDRDIDAIIRRAMATKPEDRYSSAAALADDLQAWLASRPLAWNHPGMWRRARLWARRKPSQAIATAVIAALVVAGGIVIRHFAVEANERRMEAAIAQAESAQEEAARENFIANLDWLLTELGKGQEEGTNFLILHNLWVVEWMYGPTVLTEGPGRYKVWNRRIESVRVMLENAERRDRLSAYEINNWRTSLVFWLIKTGDWREAEPLAKENVAAWRATLPADDRWLEDMQMFVAAAAVNRLADPGVSDIDPTERLVRRDELERAYRQLEQEARGSPLHFLAIEQLHKLYGPDQLDDARKFSSLREQLDALREEFAIYKQD